MQVCARCGSRLVAVERTELGAEHVCLACGQHSWPPRAPEPRPVLPPPKRGRPRKVAVAEGR